MTFTLVTEGDVAFQREFGEFMYAVHPLYRDYNTDSESDNGCYCCGLSIEEGRCFLFNHVYGLEENGYWLVGSCIHYYCGDEACKSKMLRHHWRKKRLFRYHHCEACGLKMATFVMGEREQPDNRCSGCSRVCYCSRDCQFRHWSAHKSTCRLIKSEREARKQARASGRRIHCSSLRTTRWYNEDVGIYHWEDALAIDRYLLY